MTSRAASMAWAIAASAWALTVGVRFVVAQSPAPDAARTTLSGVYTAAQATDGQPIFEATCLGGCHNAASHKGMAFEKRWAGHQLAELFQTVNEDMPQDDPGSLGPDRAAQVVAYILKMNGMPAGKDEIKDDSALRKIKIEMPPAKLARPAADPSPRRP